MAWELFIPIEPVPKSYRSARGRMLLTDKTRHYQDQVQKFVACHKPPKEFDGYLCFEAVFYLKRLDGQKNMLAPNKKPDLDNLLKSLFDPIERAGGIIKNDSRFIEGICKKRFAGGHGADGVIQPGTFIRIYEYATTSQHE